MGYERERKSTGNKAQEETTKIHFPLINYKVKTEQERRDRKGKMETGTLSMS